MLKEIYALSALKGYVSLPERERALLQEDQSEGLQVLAGDAMAETVVELMPMVKEFGLPEDNGGEQMWIELKDDYGAVGVAEGAVVALLTRSVACLVLEAIYEESGEGAAYGKKAMRGIEMVRDAIDSQCGEFPRILGWR